ncbi:MAG TPA: hypothetical protein VHD90_24945 [Phototrophicaceae bacterium]|nr:hypothetical protein [Phototrophicaceae bacterium]
MDLKIDDHFEQGLNPIWDVKQIGQSTVRAEGGKLWMINQPGQTRYTDAQIADYTYETFHFRWRPPVRMTVTAWASGAGATLHGTAGFGFWNHPFSPDANRIPRLPQAIWFFHASSENNMALCYDVPGCGWKAATLDTTRPAALAMLPFALPAALLMRIPAVYARLFPPIQRRLNVAEKLLDGNLLAQKHTYGIDWRADGSRFSIDGATVFETPYAPRGPLGFVAWIDNRWAVVTPQGKLSFGLAPIEREQSLILENVLIETL